MYDPFENVISVMEDAAKVGNIDKTYFEILKNPQRETKVSIRIFWVLSREASVFILIVPLTK